MTGFIDYLVSALSPYGEDKGVLMVAAQGPEFRAMFDESGIHDRAPICVVAGYSGSTKEWKQFEAAWAPYGNAPGFHAKRFFARDPTGKRVPPYDGWTDNQAIDYLDHLLGILKGLALIPVGALVDVRAFREYSEDERRYMTGGSATATGKWTHSGAPTKPYYVAFWKAVTEAIDQLKIGERKVEFIFDQQHTLAPLALRLYSRLKRELGEPYSSRMGRVIFESRTEALGLQAADLLVYCWYQFGLYGHEARPEVHQVLTAQRRDTLVMFTRDMMNKLVAPEPPPGTTYAPGTTHMYDPETHSFRPERPKP